MDAHIGFDIFGSIIGVTLILQWDQVWYNSIGCFMELKSFGYIIGVTLIIQWDKFDIIVLDAHL